MTEASDADSLIQGELEAAAFPDERLGGVRVFVVAPDGDDDWVAKWGQALGIGVDA